MQSGVGQKNASMRLNWILVAMEGVQTAAGVVHANSLAGQLICDIAAKVNHIFWSNFSCHLDAAGALRLARSSGAILTRFSVCAGGEEKTDIGRSKAFPVKVGEGVAVGFVFTQLRALLKGENTKECVDQVVCSCITFLVVDKTVKMRAG